MNEQHYRKLEWGALLSAIAEDLNKGPKRTQNEPLWLEVRRRVFGYARYVLKNSGNSVDDVEDVVQDVLLKLQSKGALDRLLARSHPGGYVVVMIRNAAIDAVRRGQREKSSLERYGREGGTDRSFQIQRRGASEDLVREKLHQVLRTLSPSDLALLRRRFKDGDSLKEIARDAGVKYSTLAVRLSRLLNRIAREMGVSRKVKRL